MLDKLRTRAYGVLTSKSGDRFAPVRLAKRVALRANEAAGRPLAPADEIAAQREYEGAGESVSVGERADAAPAREAAPVILFYCDRHETGIRRITDVLEGADIPYTKQNIEGDLAAIEAAERDTPYKLPIVYIGGEAVGAAVQLLNLQASGELHKLVYG